MKLLVKFSLVYILVFGLGLGAAAFIFYGQLQRNAKEQVLYHGQIIMETALAMRNYTVAQVRPAFADANRREDAVAEGFKEVCAKRADMKAAQERRSAVERAAAERAATERAAGAKLGSDAPAAPPPVVRASTPAREDLTPDPFRDICERQGPAARVFRPQTVPAFAATEIFNFLSKKYPEYQYKEATLNPTNPRDRAVDWEEDIVKAFRNRPDLTAVDGERTSALGRSVFLARPMRAAKACLECHSTPAAAPQDMIALYGSANGFGWKEDEVIAAQIVSVPVSVSVAMADRAFRQLVISLAAVAGLTLILLDLVLFLTVIRPVSRLAAMADEISTGHMDVPELEVTGNDEVSLLAASFNRMHRSLTTAMKLLDGGDDANG